MPYVRVATAIRRASLVLLVAALAVGLTVAEPLAKAAPKRQRAGSATVTRTFANSAPIAIPEGPGPAAPYPAPIRVSGLTKGRILDVVLRLNGLTHFYPDDLDILLTAPGGQNAIVLSDVGSNNLVANITLTLDDEAAAPLPDIDRLTSGRFKPTNVVEAGFPDGFPAPAPSPSGAVALSTFDGANPNGVWSLFIFDDSQGDAGGVARGWALTIEARVKKDRHGGKGHGKRAPKPSRTAVAATEPGRRVTWPRIVA
ncbi:MAG TPA: hypothetical protein VFU81_03415 [Thermomicrobiales bacterium]|nr:hypothetical protein [Thermomicrobiales bacterium]